MDYYLWTDNKSDYRLFESPPCEPPSFSYDFNSLYDALLFAKQEGSSVIIPEERTDAV